MSTEYKIKNPNADSVCGMYVDTPIGMDHLLAKAKSQNEVDATLHYLNSTSLREAIEGTLKRIRFLFGEDIPDEIVRTAVSLTYAEHAASKTKKWPVIFGPPSPFDSKGYIRNWLSNSRNSRESANIEEEKDNKDIKKSSDESNKAINPSVYISRQWQAGRILFIPCDTTKLELLAQAMLQLVGEHFRSCTITWSESEVIYISPYHWRDSRGMKRPYIVAYDCALSYPDTDTATKEDLFESTKQIAATWCPKVRLAWSSTEIIRPKLP